MTDNHNTTAILAIDIGSTRTHLAAVDISTLIPAASSGRPKAAPTTAHPYSELCVDRIDFDNAAFDELFAPSIKKILSAHPNIRKANISSCVKDLAGNAKKICIDDNCLDDAEIIKAHENLPISINYDNPQTLGTDRLCNALACAALFKERNCVIIDAGTAITIDFLRDGKVFDGGVIMPGCAMQAGALHGGTDALPLVNLNLWDADKAAIPATSTERCVMAGVLYGAAGAVERCVNEYLRIRSNDASTDRIRTDIKIAATGGGWDIIRPLININHEITTIPDLTLIGAAIFA